MAKATYSRQAAIPYFEGLVPEGMARETLTAKLHIRKDDYVSLLESCGLDCIGDVAITTGELPRPPHFSPVSDDELARKLS